MSTFSYRNTCKKEGAGAVSNQGLQAIGGTSAYSAIQMIGGAFISVITDTEALSPPLS
ncbi:MAG: hypothetical protein MK198_07560 [Gracilimonas sp.]|uniref:hypothetical protein n=1 Tax=Gracilimonas sp. TaxID=1974203 RepID=UPI003750B7A9|nr:hypothetical protein [Gracilimonas sp.]